MYRPANPEQSATYRFLDFVNLRYDLSLTTYQDLYTWSTTRIDDFWSAVWDHTKVIGYKGSHVVDANAKPADNPPWFSQAKVNWAENMLRHRSDKDAMIQTSQSSSRSPTYSF